MQLAEILGWSPLLLGFQAPHSQFMLTVDDLRGHILVSLRSRILESSTLCTMTLDPTKSPRVQFFPRVQDSLTMTIDLRLTLPRLRWSSPWVSLLIEKI